MKAYLVGLWLSMSVSLWCVIEAYLDYPGPESFMLMISIIVPGLTGLYFSTKIKTVKWRWLLLVMNYLFATGFNSVHFFIVVFELF